jgi:hypothetical protein
MVLWDNRSLQRVWRQRQRATAGGKLGTVLQQYVKKTLQPRWKKLAQVGQAWQEVLPEELVQHSCLEKLQAGQLVVKVDSAVHFYELQQLIQGDLLHQLRQGCSGVTITRIKLQRGTWIERDQDKEARIDREL